MTIEDEVHDLRLRVIRLETQMAQLFKHLDIAMADESAAGEDPELVELVRAGNMLEATKRYRQLHNSDLAEAQSAVEELKQRLGL